MQSRKSTSRAIGPGLRPCPLPGRRLPALNSTLLQLFLEQLAATAPAHFHLAVLDNGAFHKARSLRLPPHVGLLFLPPSAPAVTPLDRF